MIRFNFRKKLIKEDEFASQIVEILEEKLDDVGITVNKNAVPFDTEKPTITSGIRIGTPAVTTRGFKEGDMVKIAELINMTVESYDDKKEEIRSKVAKICEKYPLYN